MGRETATGSEEALRVQLGAFSSGHTPLLRTWLSQPHVKPWWGNPDLALAFVADHCTESQATISVGSRPVGYLCWQPLSAEDRREAGLESLPTDHLDIDILIGEEDQIGRGVGPAALVLLVDRLRSEGVGSVGLGTAAINDRARRAFEKAGFRPFHDFEEDGIQMCYLVRDLV